LRAKADSVYGAFAKGDLMSVTVDHETLPAEELGFSTVGQVLLHVQTDNRLVVNLLIDGEQPDLSEMRGLRKSSLQGKVVYIETARPGEMAMDVLDDVQEQLIDAEKYKNEAAELLQQNQLAKAMERLGIYFSTWQTAQESVLKTSQLLRLDLETLTVGSQSIAEILADFTAQLRQTRQTLVNRDFVSLADQLLYETSGTCQRWIQVLDAIRSFAGGD
jgi:hypothetical protein